MSYYYKLQNLNKKKKLRKDNNEALSSKAVSEEEID